MRYMMDDEPTVLAMLEADEDHRWPERPLFNNGNATASQDLPTL